MNNAVLLLEKLERDRSLSLSEYQSLIEAFSPSLSLLAAQKAVAVRKAVYGNDVYVRGLIEVGNICKNNCYYCGIRAGNARCERYSLTDEEILSCCEAGYAAGFRTFVMQGGEDARFSDDRLVLLIAEIKRRYPDCAVTLSLGERSFDSYRRLKEAGADRYLLRHETANAAHYAKLHPDALSFDERMRCLRDLKSLGYQVGCGFMVGSPYQTTAMLAEDLKFIETFAPDMCGIGPFIPHNDTPFAAFEAGSVDLTCYLLSLIRLIRPTVLLPATTALGSLQDDGRERGILAGANVVMPNLSPVANREKYMLYNNKLHSGAEAAESLDELKRRMACIGYEVVCARGDVKTEFENPKGGIDYGTV